MVNGLISSLGMLRRRPSYIAYACLIYFGLRMWFSSVPTEATLRAESDYIGDHGDSDHIGDHLGRMHLTLESDLSTHFSIGPGFQLLVTMRTPFIEPDPSKQLEFRTSQLVVFSNKAYPSRKVFYRSTTTPEAVVVLPLDAYSDNEVLRAVLKDRHNYCTEHSYGLYARYIQDFAAKGKPAQESLGLASLRMLRAAMAAFPHAQWFWLYTADGSVSFLNEETENEKNSDRKDGEVGDPRSGGSRSGGARLGDARLGHPAALGGGDGAGQRSHSGFVGTRRQLPLDAEALNQALEPDLVTPDLTITNFAGDAQDVDIVISRDASTGFASAHSLFVRQSLVGRAFLELVADPLMQNWPAFLHEVAGEAPHPSSLQPGAHAGAVITHIARWHPRLAKSMALVSPGWAGMHSCGEPNEDGNACIRSEEEWRAVATK